MLGGTPARNMVSTQRGIPAKWDIDAKQNIKWVVPLGSQVYGGPVVAEGRVFVGTNNAGNFRPDIRGDKGCLLCFDEKTGKLLWQATHEKLASGAANDWPEQGIASTPLVAGGRVYYVSNRCELVCADVDGLHASKNTGPFKSEKYTGEGDADFVWIDDLIGMLGVNPHNLAASSPVGAGDLIFVVTGNGIDELHEKLVAPQAPAFIAVEKSTGKVVWQRNDPDEHILHGQWSSPAYGLVGGKPQVVFAGGDGWCYAFEPKTGAPLWKFNLNPEGTTWKANGSGDRNNIVATPVIFDNKVFLAVGDDPENGVGPGHLYAIDATKAGDITQSGRVWHVGGDDFQRSLSTVAIADGLLYAADLSGYLYCLDVQTGQRQWRCDAQSAIWGSPLVVDGKVMVGTTDGEIVVVKHDRQLQELARNDMKAPIYTTPVAANGVLFVASKNYLWAVK